MSAVVRSIGLDKIDIDRRVVRVGAKIPVLGTDYSNRYGRLSIIKQPERVPQGDGPLPHNDIVGVCQVQKWKCIVGKDPEKGQVRQLITTQQFCFEALTRWGI